MNRSAGYTFSVILTGAVSCFSTVAHAQAPLVLTPEKATSTTAASSSNTFQADPTNVVDAEMTSQGVGLALGTQTQASTSTPSQATHTTVTQATPINSSFMGQPGMMADSYMPRRPIGLGGGLGLGLGGLGGLGLGGGCYNPYSSLSSLYGLGSYGGIGMGYGYGLGSNWQLGRAIRQAERYSLLSLASGVVANPYSYGNGLGSTFGLGSTLGLGYGVNSYGSYGLNNSLYNYATSRNSFALGYRYGSTLGYGVGLTSGLTSAYSPYTSSIYNYGGAISPLAYSGVSAYSNYGLGAASYSPLSSIYGGYNNFGYGSPYNVGNNPFTSMYNPAMVYGSNVNPYTAASAYPYGVGSPTTTAMTNIGNAYSPFSPVAAPTTLTSPVVNNPVSTNPLASTAYNGLSFTNGTVFATQVPVVATGN